MTNFCCLLISNRGLFYVSRAGIAFFNPRTKGEYKVNVMRNEKHINNSPFRIKVGDKEMGRASGCTVSGATDKATANTPNELIVDTENAGKE